MKHAMLAFALCALALAGLSGCSDSEETPTRTESYTIQVFAPGFAGAQLVATGFFGRSIQEAVLDDNSRATITVAATPVTKEGTIALSMNGESIFATAMTFPTVYVESCLLTRLDVVQDDGGENLLQVGVTSDRAVVGNDCDGQRQRDIIFGYMGAVENKIVSCLVNNQRIEWLFSGAIGIMPNAPLGADYLCNLLLESPTSTTPSSVVRGEGDLIPGHTLYVQGLVLTHYDVKVIGDDRGWIFRIDENGMAHYVNKHEDPKIERATIGVTIDFFSYVPYDGVQVLCDFNGWVPVTMTRHSSTSYSYTYPNEVPTQEYYACNFIDTATGLQIYDRGNGFDFIVLVNGVQVIDPIGDNLDILFDRYGNVDLTDRLVETDIACETTELFGEPVYLTYGYFGRYQGIPISSDGTAYRAKLWLPEGVWQFNITHEWGVHKALHKDTALPGDPIYECDFFVNDVEIRSVYAWTFGYDWMVTILRSGAEENDNGDSVQVGITIPLAPSP